MDDLIRNYIDRQNFASDTEFAKAQLAELEAAYKRVRDIRINLKDVTGTGNTVNAAKESAAAVKQMTTAVTEQNQIIGQSAKIFSAYGNSLQQNIANLNSYKKALAVSVTDQKEAIELKKLGVITEDEYQKRITESTAAQFKYKEAISAVTGEIKNQIKLSTAAPTSILEARTQNKMLTTQRDAIPVGAGATDEDIARVKEINALIDRNNKLIDENSDRLARQKINVGNYGPSVKAALSVLEEELIKVNAQLAVTDKNSDAFQVLTKQANLLKSVSTGLDQTFDNTKTELRALEEAAKKVGTEFGVTSTQFQKLSAEIGERKDQLKDIQSAINFQASDTRNLDAIVGAVQAVTGAYGAYQAATVLLGEDSEELQKTMVKLQAVLTLVTSVQSVANALQSESALIQGALAAKATLLGLAQKIVAIATGEASTALAAESVAAGSAAVAVDGLAVSETASAVAGEAIAVTSGEAAIAMEGEAVASGSLAVGLDAVAVSEGAVATGATSMATAIAATGIGLLIVGLAFAVYKVVDAIRDWNASNASLKKANEDLTASMRSLSDATKAFGELSRITTQRQLKDLDELMAKRKAAGVTQMESLAFDKQVADAKAKAADDDVKNSHITEDMLKKQASSMFILAGIWQSVEEAKNRYIETTTEKGDPNYKKTIENFDKVIKARKEDADFAAQTYKENQAKFDAAEEAKQQAALLADQAIKLSADERRKFIQESAKIEVDIETAKNEKILNSEYSTLDERLAALKDNLAQQKKAIEADNQAVQSDPTVSSTDKILATKKANADIAKAESESQTAIAKLKEDFRLRDLQATTGIQKKIYDVISQTNTDIYNNDALTEQQRLEALKKSIEARKAILDAQFKADLSSAGISDPEIERIKKEGFFEIENKKITNEELKKLIADYTASEVALAKESATERIKIVKDYYEQYADENEKALKKIQRENDANANSQEDAYNKNIIALNESYKQGLTSTGEYNRERLRLDTEYARKSIQIQIDNIERSLAASISAVEVEKRLQKELNDLKSQDTSGFSDDKLKEHDDRIKQVTDELNAVGDAVGKESDLYKQLSKLKKDLSEQEKSEDQKKYDRIIEGLNKVKDVASDVFDTINSVLNANATAQKNRLKDQSDAIDKNYQRELDLINASTLAEQDKAAKITVLNARVQAQKDQIALKQKQIDKDQAVAQKAQAIFSIGINTAIAVVKALPNIALSILVGVLGAAQLAAVIATPIPRFKHGKKAGGYEGLAIVDDGGKNEPILRAATGQVEISTGHPKERLTYLNKDDIVYPEERAMFPDLHKHLIMMAMPKIQPLPVVNNNNNEALYAELKKVNNNLTKIANKKELQLGSSDKGFVALWRHGANMTKYINENTNW